MPYDTSSAAKDAWPGGPLPNLQGKLASHWQVAPSQLGIRITRDYRDNKSIAKIDRLVHVSAMAHARLLVCDPQAPNAALWLSSGAGLAKERRPLG